MRFTDAVKAYDIAARATATRETVAEPLVRSFAREVQRLSRANDGFDDELWTAVMRRTRRILRELGSTPLPPADTAFQLASSVDYLTGLIAQARGNYPDNIVARADICLGALTDLSNHSENPFGELVIKTLRARGLSVSGLLVKTAYLDAVRQWLLTAAPEVKLITESELKLLTGVESLIVAGPSYWFPAHVLSTPQAESICFVHYDFLRDRGPETRLFTGSHGPPGAVVRSVVPKSPLVDDDVDVQLLTPTVDWEALARASGARRGSADDDVKAVPANLFLLVDDYAVYLEADDGPTIDIVIDLEVGGRPKLQSKRTRAIGPGDYIVLRSEGGSGDYIPGIADTLLGKHAAALRAEQARWKDALRTKVRERGFSRVERDLRSLGVASPNLRYRIWRNSLRSRDPNDFRILMEYIGLGDHAAKLYTAMGQIFEAHLRAGQEVRKLLEEAVLATDPEELIQTGRVDVRLTEMDAGTLSVLRVEDRSPKTANVDEDDLRVMVRVEPDLWQG